MAGDVARDERAQRDDLQAARPHVVQHPSRQAAAQALALVRRDDLGMQEGDASVTAAVAREAGELAVGPDLIAGLIRIVTYLGVHLPPRNLPVAGGWRIGSPPRPGEPGTTTRGSTGATAGPARDGVAAGEHHPKHFDPGEPREMSTQSSDLDRTTTRDWRQGLRILYRHVDGVRIRYAESEGPSEPTILLTSPWPESVYAFAPIWPALSASARLLAVDLPGFGESERRDDLLSPAAMGDFLVRLIEEFGLAAPHIVAPDVGTSAALFAAASRPDLFSSVVVGSGGAAVPIQLGGALEQWTLAPDLEPFRAMDPRAIVAAALATIEGHTLPPEIREDYLDSYDGDRFVESMRYVRSYPGELPELARRLPAIEVPVQIIAGRRDRAVPLVNAQFLDERLPHSRLTVVDAGHFVWEEAADEYASILADWVTGGYRDAADTRRQTVEGGRR